MAEVEQPKMGGPNLSLKQGLSAIDLPNLDNDALTYGTQKAGKSRSTVLCILIESDMYKDLKTYLCTDDTAVCSGLY